MVTVLSLIVVLGVLVFVHEAGHFAAAKWAGIYVHRFSLGLGAPIRWLTFRRGETEYSISWLPLGGYVKMASQEEEASSAALEGGRSEATVPPERTFESKPVWKRMVVILAGVTMNAIFAWAVYTFLAAKNGREYDPTTIVGRVVPELVPVGSERLGEVRPGARIVRVDGRPVETWDDIRFAIRTSGARDVMLEFADGSQVALPIHPDALEDRLKASEALQPFRAAVVGQVLDGKPADRAGFEPGDTIVAVAGDPVVQWYDLLDRLRNSAGEELVIDVARAGTRHTLRVTPELDSIPGPDGTQVPVGRIGIAVAPSTESEPYTLGEAVAAGTDATIAASTQIFRTVRGLFSGRVSRRDIGGPILIGQLAGETARLGLDAFLEFMALISVNLAILNLLPIPVLDGGQFLFLLAEAVIRRPLPLKLRERLTTVGLVLIVLLMGLAFSNDLRRVFGG